MAIYRVRAVQSGWTGGPGLSSFYFREDIPLTAVSLAGANDCINRVRNAFSANVGLWPTTWSMSVQGQVDVLDPLNGQIVDTFAGNGGTPLTGLGNEGFGPLPVGIQIKYGTSGLVAGRRVRGRTYLVPVRPMPEVNGTPRSADTVMGTDIGTKLLDRSVLSPVMVIWSRPVTVATPSVPVRVGSTHDVLTATCPDKFVVLRSRRD